MLSICASREVFSFSLEQAACVRGASAIHQATFTNALLLEPVLRHRNLPVSGWDDHETT